MSLVVQKYGGTSVGTLDHIASVARHVDETVRQGRRVIVTISAMGEQTDDLIEMARKLNPKPGASFGDTFVPNVIPDVFVELNDEGKYVVRAKYFASDANRASARTKVYATITRLGFTTDELMKQGAKSAPVSQPFPTQANAGEEDDSSN